MKKLTKKLWTPYWRSLALLLILISLSALPSPAASGSKPSAAHATVSDAQIEQTIRAKLAKSKIGAEGVRFQVQRGVVTWEGKTNVAQRKGSATRMAKSAGAIRVVNNIQVSQAGKDKAAAGLRRAQVKQ